MTPVIQFFFVGNSLAVEQIILISVTLPVASQNVWIDKLNVFHCIILNLLFHILTFLG